ncbi:hypothetical protein SAMN05216499_1559 [Actinacidiphila paucisporea]|uniref:Uncharacterized protein n=1 Tax=Actinacidiphila paucisporea TaxID=310782 RepID=A0A1M7QZU1_9ACTN|nr:hypothetical protein SAMN05216499_1559 [Actinacidiphila paucisporea]
MPISLPSARISRTSAGWAATWVPTTKNVAWTWWRRSTARIFGVQTGSGPSSKVSAMVCGRGRAVRAGTAALSITGPPWKTPAGAWLVGPGREGAASSLIPNMCWV